jgi:hypothetical protein
MESNPFPAYSKLQRHKVKYTKTIDPEQAMLNFQSRNYRNKGRGASFGRGGGHQRGRTIEQYEHRQKLAYTDSLEHVAMEERFKHHEQHQSTSPTPQQPTQAPIYVAKCYKTDSAHIDYADVSASASSDASHKQLLSNAYC